MAKFISIEGSEGAGKSTALKFIQQYFQALNLPVVITREPGGTNMAEKIRELLLHSDTLEAISNETEALLMYAGRVQHLNNCILPALSQNKWVVSDRYVDASFAYQGGGRGVSLELLKALDKFAIKDIYPDLTLLLDLPAELGLKRTEHRNYQDRIEREKLDFFIRVREAYLERANANPERIKIIDASRSLKEVQTSIKNILDTFIKNNQGQNNA